MERKKYDPIQCEGILPSSAPLANPYVPFQREDPPKYEARTALVRGTLYPGLDLPFMGMENRKDRPLTPMSELQTMAFALQELALYLDTHRDDQKALELYRNIQQLYHKGLMAFENDEAPITHLFPSNKQQYAWLDDPWPWEYCKN